MLETAATSRASGCLPALDSTVYTLLSNHIGTTGGRHACVGSGVWGPCGKLLADVGVDGRGLAVADLEHAVLKDARARETMPADIGECDPARVARHAVHSLV